MFIVSNSTISTTACEPAKTFISSPCKLSLTYEYLSSLAITTAFGLNFNACLINKSALLFAVKTSAVNHLGLLSITSNACVPIEPVEPRIATFIFDEFLIINILLNASVFFNHIRHIRSYKIKFYY